MMISYKTIIDRIKKVSSDSKIVSGRPKIGKMYTYIYNPKTKEKLPYYDTVPLVIPVSYERNGFYGLNFHYLPLRERNELLNIILPFTDKTKKEKIKISYTKLVSLASGLWSPCCKRYLWSHIRTKILLIPVESWYDVIKLPVISFQKVKTSDVYRITRKKMR